MSFTNIIGTAGVAMILLAYFMNTIKMIPVNGKLFYVLNTIGAALACYASILIEFWPFVVLESAWTLVSIYGLIRSMGVKMT
jgi:hypothetical protein